MPMFGLMTYNFQQLTKILFATQIELAVISEPRNETIFQQFTTPSNT